MRHVIALRFLSLVFVATSLVGVKPAHAGILSVYISGKVVAFDEQRVVIEMEDHSKVAVPRYAVPKGAVRSGIHVLWTFTNPQTIADIVRPGYTRGPASTGQLLNRPAPTAAAVVGR